MKYLCLAYGSEEDWNKLDKREQQQLLAQDEVVRKRGGLVAAVDPHTTVVRAWDGTPKTDNGPFADSEVPLAGFSIIEADDEEQVVRLVADSPCARAGGAVEIRPIAQINDVEAMSPAPSRSVADDTAEASPNVGPAHRRLDVFTGTWSVEGQNFGAAPDASNSKVSGEERYEWMPGNFFLVSHFDRQFTDGGRHTGMGVLKYDATIDAYSLHAFDNLGFARRYAVSVSGNQWKIAGDHERAEIDFSDDGRTMKAFWEIATDGSTWRPLCELTATKA
jgi:hypothetical protein